MDSEPQALISSSAANEASALLYPTAVVAPPNGVGLNYVVCALSLFFPFSLLKRMRAAPQSDREVMCAVCSSQAANVQTVVRWGRTACTGVPDATLLYSGWAANGNSSMAGSGSNMLWLGLSRPSLCGWFFRN